MVTLIFFCSKYLEKSNILSIFALRNNYKLFIYNMSFGKTPLVLRGGVFEKPSHYLPDIKTVKFVNKSDNENPKYAHDGDSGFDLRAWIKEDDEGAKLSKEEEKYQITLKSLERRLIHTGLYFELPEMCELQVRPRSGAALKQGLSVCNTPGTVDFGYRNEVGIIAINLSNKPITITSGDRIAQAVLMPVYGKELVNLTQVDEISNDTSRNLKGFGSSGVK